MDIRIEATGLLPSAMEYSLKMIGNALVKPETAELLKAFPDGEHFKMDYGKISITITKVKS